MIQSYNDLEVYKRSFQLAMDIFWMTKNFPKEEIYSLTSQIVSSSRSISANISEGLRKRNFERVFKQHLVHAMGSTTETETWIKFALECKYISAAHYEKTMSELDQLGKMLNKLHQNWKSNGK